MRVNPGTPVGTVISNQAVVSSAGQPNLLTDSDGNPANAPQPTVVVVGAGQQVSISAQVSVVGGGAAIPGAQLDYLLNIVNTRRRARLQRLYHATTSMQRNPASSPM